MNVLAAPRMRLGNYEPLLQLATGGMATVYVARQLGAAGFERLVVVKRVHPHLLSNHDFSDMLRDEARVASLVRHPNVVPVIDVVEADGELFLVQEYVESAALSTLWKAANEQGGPLSIAVGVRVIADVLAGLHAAHEAVDMRGVRLEVVHRDISPQNIVVGVDGGSRLIDFGVAKAQHRITETKSGSFKGKYGYMSPEQAKAIPIDRRSDLFAAGSVLHEVLTGRRLFQGENEFDTFRRIAEGEIGPPSAIVPGIPIELDRVVMRALDRDRDARFQTAAEFLEALEAAYMPAPARDVATTVERRCGTRLAERRSALTRMVEGAIAPLDPVQSPRSEQATIPSIPSAIRRATDGTMGASTSDFEVSAARRKWWIAGVGAGAVVAVAAVVTFAVADSSTLDTATSFGAPFLSAVPARTERVGAVGRRFGGAHADGRYVDRERSRDGDSQCHGAGGARSPRRCEVGRRARDRRRPQRGARGPRRCQRFERPRSQARHDAEGRASDRAASRDRCADERASVEPVRTLTRRSERLARRLEALRARSCCDADEQPVALPCSFRRIVWSKRGGHTFDEPRHEIERTGEREVGLRGERIQRRERAQRCDDRERLLEHASITRPRARKPRDVPRERPHHGDVLDRSKRLHVPVVAVARENVFVRNVEAVDDDLGVRQLRREGRRRHRYDLGAPGVHPHDRQPVSPRGIDPRRRDHEELVGERPERRPSFFRVERKSAIVSRRESRRDRAWVSAPRLRHAERADRSSIERRNEVRERRLVPGAERERDAIRIEPAGDRTLERCIEACGELAHVKNELLDRIDGPRLRSEEMNVERIHRTLRRDRIGRFHDVHPRGTKRIERLRGDARKIERGGERIDGRRSDGAHRVFQDPNLVH